jgi:AcrB/AcrD/AcrF family
VFFGAGFAAAAGIYAVAHLPLDAIPDLSDTQVIVYTEYPGQAPQVIEDQVTYPLTTAMLTVPRSKVVRGFSFFGVSFVYVIFEDGTDIYWARSRVLEFLNGVASRLPARTAAVLQPADHHRVVHADLHAGIPGRPAVQSPCLHQDFLDGRSGTPFRHAGAGIDGGVRAGKDHSGAS